jgi:RNA-directed DNA polymerase
MSESKSKGKSFEIDKMVVWKAYLKVVENGGAAGVDGQTIEDFKRDARNGLYRIWNRMCSGSYFPPPVAAVEIPKVGGGVRVLGVPTVADRIAQTVVAMTLEPLVEPVFHADSYGYRPGRSALDAVATCRRRCWRHDWVIDLDIKSFFDTVPHDLIIKAVEAHTDSRWVLLYVKRWLQAPTRQPDGTIVTRDRGTPQGSAISPLLANLFMHYAFDTWLTRNIPSVRFERYCDDAVVHCDSEAQARQVLAAIDQRLTSVGLRLHPDKTKIVYCKDGNRRGGHDHTGFTFLGYDFRCRQAVDSRGKAFYNFLPAVSAKAITAMGRQLRSWHVGRRVELSMGDIARWINPIVRGWINYYGRFYRSELIPFLQRINRYLMHWLRHKYKRRCRSAKHARRALEQIYQAHPGWFIHWRYAPPEGWTTGAV